MISPSVIETPVSGETAPAPEVDDCGPARAKRRHQRSAEHLDTLERGFGRFDGAVSAPVVEQFDLHAVLDDVRDRCTDRHNIKLSHFVDVFRSTICLPARRLPVAPKRA